MSPNLTARRSSGSFAAAAGRGQPPEGPAQHANTAHVQTRTQCTKWPNSKQPSPPAGCTPWVWTGSRLPRHTGPRGAQPQDTVKVAPLPPF